MIDWKKMIVFEACTIIAFLRNEEGADKVEEFDKIVKKIYVP